MVHELKCIPEFFEAVVKGDKPFTLRRNDRNYQVGDTVWLNEWSGEQYTGNRASYRITYVLQDFEGLESGYCVLGLLNGLARR